MTCASEGSRSFSGLFVMFEILAADTDRENLLCSQANDRAERLLKAHTAITEKSRSQRRDFSSRTGWKIKGIAADAQMWSTVILVATVTSRTRFHIGWPFFPLNEEITLLLS